MSTVVTTNGQRIVQAGFAEPLWYDCFVTLYPISAIMGRCIICSNANSDSDVKKFTDRVVTCSPECASTRELVSNLLIRCTKAILKKDRSVLTQALNGDLKQEGKETGSFPVEPQQFPFKIQFFFGNNPYINQPPGERSSFKYSQVVRKFCVLCGILIERQVGTFEEIRQDSQKCRVSIASRTAQTCKKCEEVFLGITNSLSIQLPSVLLFLLYPSEENETGA